MVTNDEGFQSWQIVPFASPWARVKNITEQIEVDSSKEGVAKERATFEIYYREGINKSMSIIFRKNIYQITAIFNPGFDNKTLILTGERNDSLGDATI